MKECAICTQEAPQGKNLCERHDKAVAKARKKYEQEQAKKHQLIYA